MVIRQRFATRLSISNIQDYDAAMAAVESGKGELTPAEVVFAIQDGANPIKVAVESAQAAAGACKGVGDGQKGCGGTVGGKGIKTLMKLSG
jgi:hypothetical protein